MKRTLRLDRETLTELTTEELQGVAGGVPKTLNIRECVGSWDPSCIDCITRLCTD